MAAEKSNKKLLIIFGGILLFLIVIGIIIYEIFKSKANSQTNKQLAKKFVPNPSSGTVPVGTITSAIGSIGSAIGKLLNQYSGSYKGNSPTGIFDHCDDENKPVDVNGLYVQDNGQCGTPTSGSSDGIFTNGHYVDQNGVTVYVDANGNYTDASGNPINVNADGNYVPDQTSSCDPCDQFGSCYDFTACGNSQANITPSSGVDCTDPNNAGDPNCGTTTYSVNPNRTVKVTNGNGTKTISVYRNNILVGQTITY